MKSLTEAESISLFVALAVVASMFFAVAGNPFAAQENTTETAALTPKASDIVFITDTDPVAAQETLRTATDGAGKLTKLVVQDTKVGEGAEVKKGDSVSVHYIGTLPDGSEFDNSLKRDSAFTFVVGAGNVIKGWDEGIVGMKVGGERILIIPPTMAYGDRGIGVIPPGSTLLFSITLLGITP
jgi:FKBP-type peptidyl-prolyl cis-trans isomerase